MPDFLKSLRAFAQGSINESTMKSDMDTDAYDFENDEEFIQECMDACMGTMLYMDVLGETADTLDEAVKEAYITLSNYLIGQGVMSEAATVNLNNPKVNFVKLSRKAQTSRLTSIITLKMARKAGSPNFKKYKIGMKIKKDNMQKMREKYGKQAEKLAMKLMRNMKKRGKVVSITDQAKTKAGTKK